MNQEVAEPAAAAVVTGSRRAKRAVLKPEITSDRFETPSLPDVDLSLGRVITQDNSIDLPDGPLQSDYVKELAFMEEEVTVMVNETNDENEIPMVDIYVNGRVQYFPRGVAVKCRRKFLEGLVRSKPVNVRCQAVVPGAGQEPVNKVSRTTAIKYPFTVIEDKNPNGNAWLRKIMAEQ